MNEKSNEKNRDHILKAPGQTLKTENAYLEIDHLYKIGKKQSLKLQ